MLGDHVRCVLDGIACLFIRSGLFQNMGRKHIPDVMGSMRQQALDHTAAGVGVEDAVTLDGQFPCLVKGRLIVGGSLLVVLTVLMNRVPGSSDPPSRTRRCRPT